METLEPDSTILGLTERPGGYWNARRHGLFAGRFDPRMLT
jgi:hypothetical protein